jgi:hypothetical protein
VVGWNEAIIFRLIPSQPEPIQIQKRRLRPLHRWFPVTVMIDAAWLISYRPAGSNSSMGLPSGSSN